MSDLATDCRTRDKHTGQELVQRQPAAASRVPDHVRNPGSYTCYTLDEPVWVGGAAGDLKPQDPWQAAQEVGLSWVSAHARRLNRLLVMGAQIPVHIRTIIA